jgi:choline dehydrogenase-like flavoprotein
MWDASAHGTDGPLGVTMAPISFPSDDLIINLTKELPNQFPYNPDLSAGDSLGFGWLPVTTSNGSRASSWTSYLQPVLSRTNLDIVSNTQVTRVLKTGEENGLPAFRGVEYAANSTCMSFHFRTLLSMLIAIQAFEAQYTQHARSSSPPARSRHRRS